jgi:hypothetical protein
VRTPFQASRAFALVAALAMTGLGAPALAQPKTTFQVLVAQVSSKGSDVDPALKSMADDFKKTGLPYTSFKLVNRASVSLAPGGTEAVKLPNGVAQLTFVKVEGNAVRLKVAAPFSTSEYSITAGGEVYIDAGAHGATKLFLAVKR